MNLLAVLGSDGRWEPGLGDNTAMGWITVAAYGVTAVLCVAYALRARRSGLPRGHQMLWLAFTALLLFLGVNEQMDFQLLATEIGRDIAIAQGWYEQRHGVQRLFIGGMAAAGLLGIIAMFVLTARHRGRNWPALAGLGILTTFIVTRAASFHHMDVLMDVRIARLELDDVLELCGIIVIAAAAAWNLRKSSPAPAAHEKAAERTLRG